MVLAQSLSLAYLLVDQMSKSLSKSHPTAIVQPQGVQYLLKPKYVSKYHFKLNSVILQRCPGLQIVYYRLKYQISLFGTDPRKNIIIVKQIHCRNVVMYILDRETTRVIQEISCFCAHITFATLLKAFTMKGRFYS